MYILTTTKIRSNIIFCNAFRGNVKEGIITGTSVSTSVSSSTSVQQSDHQDKSKEKNLSPAELLRQRLKLLYSQRRRFY